MESDISTSEPTELDITVRDVPCELLKAIRPSAQAAHKAAGRTGSVSNPVLVRWTLQEFAKRLNEDEAAEIVPPMATTMQGQPQ